MSDAEKKIRREIYKLLVALNANHFALGVIGSWAAEDIPDEDVLEVLTELNNGTLQDRIKIIAERPPLPDDKNSN